MAGSERKRRPPRARLPSLPLPATGRGTGRAPVSLTAGAGGAGSAGGEDSIYTLRGYKAWAARVKAAWDAES